MLLPSRRPRFNPWARKIPWRRKWQPTPAFLLGNSMDRGTWWSVTNMVSKSHRISFFFFLFNLWLHCTFFAFSLKLIICLVFPFTSLFCLASLVPQLIKNPPAVRETWVQFLVWEDALEKGKAAHSSILAWKIPWIV